MADRLIPQDHPAAAAAIADRHNVVACPKHATRFHARPMAHCAAVAEALPAYPTERVGEPCPHLAGWIGRELKPERTLGDVARGLIGKPRPATYVEVRPFCNHPRPLQVMRIFMDGAGAGAGG